MNNPFIPTLMRLKRLVRRREGVAAVEFALVVPIMLVLYMGSIEVSQIMMVDSKLSATTSSLSDLVARADNSISATTIDDYVSAAGLIMTPYDTTGLKQRITSVAIDADGNTSVDWSIAYNGATPATLEASFDVPQEIIDISHENWVIVSQGEMAYQPWGGFFFDSAVTLSKSYYNLPRFQDEIELIGTSGSGTHGTAPSP